jgi:hypothetical protein
MPLFIAKLWIGIKTRNPLRYTIIHQLELRIDIRAWNSHRIHHVTQEITTEGEHARTSSMQHIRVWQTGNCAMIRRLELTIGYRAGR